MENRTITKDDGKTRRALLIRWGAIAAVAAVVMVVAIVLVGRFTGGGEGPDQVAYGRDMCATCRMHLAQPGFAGQIRDAEGKVTKYDDIGCLLRALPPSGASSVRAWVEDHASHAWVPLEQATFVRSKITTPMGSGIVAFARAEDAKALLASGGELVSLDALRASSPGAAPAEPATLAASPGDPRPLTEADAKLGKALYIRECSACHGERGDGEGPASAFISPPPRNFLKAKFRLRTTPSGTPPATADVLAVIERGIPGTSMPSFRFLSVAERRQIAAFVLSRADLLDGKEPKPVADPGPAPPASEEIVARGEHVYKELQCATCHGPRGKGDGPSASGQKDEAGREVKPRDFTSGVFRGGNDPRGLYYRFTTGMDGSPMPAYGDSIKAEDRWALVHFVMALSTPAVPAKLSSDPIEAGRAVAEKYSCRGCHVLDDGKGGDVGPDLRLSGQKLDGTWIRTFLKAPREAGKLYPWRVHRMPDLGLSPEEVEVMTRYVLAIGKRDQEAARQPASANFDAAKLKEGMGVFAITCANCHNLRGVIDIPSVKHEGPDLIGVFGRVDYEWAHSWIADPKKIDPKTRMTTSGITVAQADAVRAFVWKSSMDSHTAGPPNGRKDGKTN